jgi:hypothetical protein
VKDKYLNCHNCKNVYDCDKTYLGGCTDGTEWVEDGNEKDNENTKRID